MAQRALVRGVSRRKVVAGAFAILTLIVVILGGGGLPPAFAGATAAGLLALVAFEMWAYRQVQAARLRA